MRSLLSFSTTSSVEEKLTLRIKADNSGNIYLPTAWYSSEWLQKCEYKWKVKIDDGEEVEYNGIWSSNWKIRVGYGLTPLSVHTVTIKPIEEWYGWLRAFWYKGTDIASSLINIISDKSYKGYAVSSVFTGDWYKAYQYYGCNSLINTDEELLPDTLEVIGNNYRYYEYAGCTSLVSNADEKILKTVKAIWDNYRAYQYQNCIAINNINMRAINWASVGNNYRYNQFSWIGTDRNLVDIYVEWGIEEGGDWWLNNDTVKWIYVYKDLVSDYQTKLSTITSSKIQKNDEWDNLEYEFIEYIALADSNGEVRIPVWWFSIEYAQNCAYDWMVSIDWGEEEEISGTGWKTYVSVGSDLVEWSEHRVIIKPKTLWWWWGRAFWFSDTWAQAYIKEFIHDSYKCYASSRTDTGNCYKYRTFIGCTNLINSYEKLPTSVTTIGGTYMAACYSGCTGLKTACWEVMHSTITLGTNAQEKFRWREYMGCSAMEVHQWIVGNSWIYPPDYRGEYLSGAGNNMDVYITRKEVLPWNVVASMSRADRGDYTLYTVVSDWKYKFSWDLVSDAGFVNSYSVYCRIMKNWTQIKEEEYYYYDAWYRSFMLDIDAVAWDVISFQVSYVADRVGHCENIKLEKEYSSIWLVDSNVNKIYCYVNDICDYQSNSNWSWLSNKFVAWYYGYTTHTAIDINRYTKLVTSTGVDKSRVTWNWWWDLVGQISVSKESWFPKILINGTWYGYNVNNLNLLKYEITPYDLNTINKIWERELVFSINQWYSLRWCSWDMDIEGNIYSGFTYNDYYCWLNLKNKQYQTKRTWVSWFVTKVSRNWQFIFSYLVWYKRFVDTGIDYNEELIDTTNIWDLNYSLFFSDDGLTMYKANSDNTEIQQYSLGTPRKLETATNTWKKLSISGWYYDMSSDGKYLFKYDDGVIYQYTYE